MERAQSIVPGPVEREQGQGQVYAARLIRERKELKRATVQRKIRQDLQIIADRKVYQEELEPFPEGAFERLQRENVWENVLSYITDPSDITSAYLACQTFGRILETRRMLLFLPETLTILGRSNVMYLRNLRKVSKSTKESFDRLMFDDEFSDDSWPTKFNVFNLPWFRVDLDCERDINKALSRMPQKESRIVRHVTVDSGDVKEDDVPRFWDAVLRFLDVHGKSVWHLKYHGKIGNETRKEYAHLWHLVQKMPNLKALVLLRVSGPVSMHSAREKALLVEEFERKPFPPLESLLLFHYFCSNELLLEHVYSRCKNLRIVGFVHDFFRAEGVETALRNLQLERFYSLSLSRPEFLSAMVTSSWPLKVLNLTCFFEAVDNSVLWPALSRFHGTLEHLALYCSFDGVRRNDDQAQLHLPHLKVLTLRMDIRAGTIGFDDLIPLQHLEELSLIGKYREESRPGDVDAIVHVHGLSTKMEQSNVWEIFPFLRKLTIDEESFKRN